MIKLCLACFGAYGNYMCFGSTSGAPYTNKSCTLSTLGATYIRPQRAPLSFPFSGLFMLSVAPRCNREWNEQPQQGLGELERISARTTHQTVALGQILSALYERSRRGRVTSLTRLASRCSVWPSVSQLSPTQPNPTQSGSAPFPILLFMRWHFYPPIKTFKGPLSKRKECCFNSVVAPCLGPFFSVCNQLASCLMFSSQRRAKRGPSPLWDVWQQLRTDHEPSFHCPKHSEQTINPWHAFDYFSPIVSVSPLHGSQV